jgi:hypothetical protein
MGMSSPEMSMVTGMVIVIVITTRLSLPHSHLTHVRQDVGIFKGPPGTTRVEAADIPAHWYGLWCRCGRTAVRRRMRRNGGTRRYWQFYLKRLGGETQLALFSSY